MQTRFARISFGLLLLWASLAVACAPHWVRLDVDARRRAELSLGRFGDSIALVMDAPREVSAVALPEFARLVREGQRDLALADPARASLVFVVSDVREESTEVASSRQSEEVRYVNNRPVSVGCSVSGTSYRRTVRFRWTLVQRTTQRVLLSREWASVRSDSSAGFSGCNVRAVDTVALLREARAGVGEDLANMVADRSESTLVRLVDCEGLCGAGYDAALAGRFAEAERHFRAAVERYTPGARDGAAALAFHNLSECASLAGRHNEAAEFSQRAWHADPSNPEIAHRGGEMSEREQQLRGLRMELARLR
ncbi:MAG: tetratricopeptide repeat protein [Polyangiales bacterium]